MQLPQSIEIIEVCPRDGFQNIKKFIETKDKLEIIDSLVKCGLQEMEVTSFVNPKSIPQMVDAVEVLRTAKRKHPHVQLYALAPNLKGALNAVNNGADGITFVISASEAHNMANTKQTIDSSIAALQEVSKIKGPSKLRLAVATAFDCPFYGQVAPDNVLRVVKAGIAAGVSEIALADTIGTATPKQMVKLHTALQQALPKQQFTYHIHDTYGMGLANLLTLMQLGATRFETSAFGLGGCPFAPGAAGNIASEDLVYMLHKLEINTGIDLDKLLAATDTIGARLGMIPGGHTSTARLYCKK